MAEPLPNKCSIPLYNPKLVLLLLLLTVGSSFAQTIYPGHIGKLESGAGAVPYINQPYMAFQSGNYAYIVGNGTNNLEIIDVTNPVAPVHKGSVRLLGLPNCIYVSGNFIYVGIFGATKVGAVEIVDATNPATPFSAGSITDGTGGALLGNPISIFVVGNYAYVASPSSNALEILDVSNPALPIHKGSLVDGVGGASLKTASSIFVVGNYAYIVGYNNNALEIVDISIPANPVHAGLITDGTGGAALKSASSVFVSGIYAYIVTDYSNTLPALEIIDISNPKNPLHKGRLTDGNGVMPYIGSFFPGAWSIYVSGNYAYIASFDHNSLEIVDVSNPATPIHKSSLIDGEGGALLKGAYSAFVNGNYAYVASNGSNALEIVDISNPAAPKHKGSLASATGGALLSSPTSVVVEYPFAYVASNGSNALSIVDISNPANPTQKATLVNGNGSTPYLSYPSSIFKLGKYVYVVSQGANALGFNALEIIDVSNPSLPTHVSSIKNGDGGVDLNFPNSVYVSGNYAYVANSVGSNATFASLEIIDVTNPALPIHKGFLKNGIGGALLKGAYSVFVLGNYAYVASRGSNALEIIDVTNPVAPVHKSSLVDGVGGAKLLGARSVQVVGNYAYVVSSGSNALEIVDVTNPAAPVHAGSLVDGISQAPYLNLPTSVYVVNNYAYITSNGNSANTTNSLEIVDVSNPTLPIHKASVLDRVGGANLQKPVSVFTAGNYAYVASNFGSALEIIFLYSPNVTTFTPNTGSEGTQVTITGQNFNTSLTASFNGSVAKSPSAVSLTSAVFTVPSDAKTGKITISQNGAPSSSNANFIVTPSALAPTSIQQTSFSANWTDVGAITYYIDVSLDNFSTFITGYNNLNVGNKTNILITGLTQGATYQYRIRSSDGTAPSSNSNAVSALTIPSTPTPNLTTLIGQTNFTATWPAIAGSVNYFVDVASDNTFNNFVGSYKSFKVTANTLTVTGLNPFSTYYYRIQSSDASGTSPFSSAVTVTTTDNFPPVIIASSTNSSNITLGNTPTFNATITDNVIVDIAKIFHRGISKKSFDSTSLVGPGGVGGSYAVVIQSNWYDSLGFEYYFLAKDKAGNKTATSSSFVQLVTPSISLPALPSGTDKSSYRIVSFPYHLSTDNKVTTIYNGVPWNDNTKAGLWWWNPSKNGSGGYDQYGSATSPQTVDPGKGYWVITKTSIIPQITNVTASNYNRSNLYKMTLNPGWNEIGNPYPVPISWDDVVALNKTINQTALFSPLNLYGESGFKSSTILKPFEGGFVKNLTSSDIIIQIPFSGQTSLGGRIANLDSDLSPDAWSVFLDIEQNGHTNELGGFGMHPSAQVGYDRFDNFNPPHFLDLAEINFTNKDQPSLVFSKDVVPLQKKYTWQFSPSGKIGEAAKLIWNSATQVASGKDLYLLDEERICVLDMTTVSQYEFLLTDKSRFRIFYGNDVQNIITTSMVAASEPFPNPLTNELSTTIKLALPDDQDEYQVSFHFFNYQGISIESSTIKLPPGIHPLDFNFTTTAVNSGIYFYKLSVVTKNSSSVYTGKIIKP